MSPNTQVPSVTSHRWRMRLNYPRENRDARECLVALLQCSHFPVSAGVFDGTGCCLLGSCGSTWSSRAIAVKSCRRLERGVPQCRLELPRRASKFILPLSRASSLLPLLPPPPCLAKPQATTSLTKERPACPLNPCDRALEPMSFLRSTRPHRRYEPNIPASRGSYIETLQETASEREPDKQCLGWLARWLQLVAGNERQLPRFVVCKYV